MSSNFGGGQRGSADASTSTGANSRLQSEFFFGWDLLYKTIASDVNKKADVLIALIHFMLVKHAKFECIGIGEDKTLSAEDIGSELLPDNWNCDLQKYALRYKDGKRLYLLLGQRSENCLIINLLDMDTKKASNILLDPEEMVHATKGRITDMIPNASHLADRIRKEVVDPVFLGSTKEVTTQTTTPAERANPLRISEPMRPLGQYVPNANAMEPRPFGFPDVGRGDLDPLGRIGSGNLLAFPSRPQFHGQPRFDPFGPPDPNAPQRPNPNPDHLQPPNFGGHDFYM